MPQILGKSPYCPSLWYHAKENLQIADYEIPENAVILINLYNIHRNPDFFENAADFKPERFLAENPPAGFIPYGYGPRKCIGSNLAHAFIHSFITQFYATFQTEMKNDYMPSTVRLTISQKENFRLGLKPIN